MEQITQDLFFIIVAVMAFAGLFKLSWILFGKSNRRYAKDAEQIKQARQ